jgi:hypothetical protein
VRTLLALATLATLVVGCYGNATPGPTPGSMDDVIANIVLQDVTVLHLTSGDAGCPNSSLHDNAVHMTLVIGAQSASHEVYLLRWKNDAEYGAAEQAFLSCVEEYRVLNPTMRVATLYAPPWRAFGPSLEGPIGVIVFNALRAAGGGAV